jgi:hypothetical protein
MGWLIIAAILAAIALWAICIYRNRKNSN